MNEADQSISELHYICCHKGETIKKLEAKLGQTNKSIQEFKDTFKRQNKGTMAVPEGKENFHNLVKEFVNRMEEGTEFATSLTKTDLHHST